MKNTYRLFQMLAYKIQTPGNEEEGGGGEGKGGEE